jgi:hypothetical protein
MEQIGAKLLKLYWSIPEDVNDSIEVSTKVTTKGT